MLRMLRWMVLHFSSIGVYSLRLGLLLLGTLIHVSNQSASYASAQYL